MATPNPVDFPLNNSQRNPPPFSKFIRMKRVPQRGRKTKLGLKKLINKFENQVTQGQQVQGTIHVEPSAPSAAEDGSDCESWGSDFSEGENTEDLSWEFQEEMENDINDMLEAAMERKKKLQNSDQVSSNEAQGLPSRSDAHLRPERLDVFVDRKAPPLPPRNPEVVSGSSPMDKNQGNRTLTADASTGRNISYTIVNSPLGNTDKARTIPQLSLTKAMSVPSTSNITNAASRTPELPTRSESLETTPQQPIPAFPPDVTSFPNNSPTFLRLSSGKSIPAANTSTAPERHANSKENREATHAPDGTQVGNPQRVKLPEPELRDAASSQPEGSNEKSVPPPLPSRPPPVRPRSNQPKGPTTSPPAIKNKPTHLGAPASTSKAKTDASVFNNHPVQPLLISAAKLRITKNTSPSLASLGGNASQNPSSSDSLKPIPSASGNLFPPDVVRLPEKPESKRRSIAVPKIIKELDQAVLKQILPKKRDKSPKVVEMEHSVPKARSFSSCENSAKADNATNSHSDDYLNPKDVLTEEPRFTPDRPTLPRRLKHARSLPLLYLTDSLKRDTSKNKVTTDEQNRLKLPLQPPQASNEKSKNDQELLAANDDVFRQPWYHPVTWPQAQLQLIKMAQDGAFLVRPSSKVLEGVPFTLSVYFRGRVINCHISSTPGRKFVLGNLKPNQKIFDTITELIRFHQSTPAELKISKEEPVSKVSLLITPPKDSDKIYADA